MFVPLCPGAAEAAQLLWLMGGSCPGKGPFSLQPLALGCLRLQLLKLPQLLCWFPALLPRAAICYTSDTYLTVDFEQCLLLFSESSFIWFCHNPLCELYPRALLLPVLSLLLQHSEAWGRLRAPSLALHCSLPWALRTAAVTNSKLGTGNHGACSVGLRGAPQLC